MAESSEPFAVCKVNSKGSSLRISLPKDVAQKLKIGNGKYVGFYEDNGKIIIRKVK